MCLLSMYVSCGMLRTGARAQEDMAWLSSNFPKWMGKQHVSSCSQPRGHLLSKKGLQEMSSAKGSVVSENRSVSFAWLGYFNPS